MVKVVSPQTLERRGIETEGEMSIRGVWVFAGSGDVASPTKVLFSRCDKLLFDD